MWTTRSPSFALRDVDEEEEEARYRTVVWSGERGCSVTGNSQNPPQSLRHLSPQAVVTTPANNPGECNEDNDNDNENDMIMKIIIISTLRY